MGRLRELAQLANIVLFDREFQLQLGLRTAPLSNLTKARRHRSLQQVSAREVFPQKPITINNPALYSTSSSTRLQYSFLGNRKLDHVCGRGCPSYREPRDHRGSTQGDGGLVSTHAQSADACPIMGTPTPTATHASSYPPRGSRRHPLAGAAPRSWGRGAGRPPSGRPQLPRQRKTPPPCPQPRLRRPHHPRAEARHLQLGRSHNRMAAGSPRPGGLAQATSGHSGYPASLHGRPNGLTNSAARASRVASRRPPRRSPRPPRPPRLRRRATAARRTGRLPLQTW